MAKKKEIKVEVEEPQVEETVVMEEPVVKPAKKEVEPKKEKWEIKDRIYYLKRNRKPLTYSIKSTGIYYFDEEKGYERELKYCSNQRTCFVDEIIDVGLPPSEEELLQLQSDIKKVISMLIEQGLDMQLPDFEIDTESRIISLWNLCTKVPMSIEMRNKLLSHNSIDDRFEELNNYVQLILKKSFN